MTVSVSFGVKATQTMLKYYVYISATKVEMLYSQIPADFLKGAEAELKVNLGVISTSVKGRGPEEAKELSARVAAVGSYIRDHDEVGTVENPKSWIEGIASMRWGCVREYASDIAFFGGKLGTRTLALLGSSESLIGEPKVSEANHASFYYTMRFFNAMLANRRFKEERDWRFENAEKPPYNSYAKSVDIAYGALAGTEANLEFLALVLHQEEKLVVATPLFVALAR
jgi:hypothetical protein